MQTHVGVNFPKGFAKSRVEVVFDVVIGTPWQLLGN